ncbi:MAG: PIN domain-containing protein [Solirubrobacterales bacterium]|nr:PIN domain-containing protein [Solirubrobacterales bacterium]
MASRGLADTSVFVAAETGRPLGSLANELSVATVTLTELELGVLAAAPADRARRLRTLSAVREAVAALPLDDQVASRLAELLAQLRGSGRKPKLFDTIIAATALHHDLPVYTQDDDFDAIAAVNEALEVKRV